MPMPKIRSEFPLLRLGQTFRLAPDCGCGDVFEVVGVSECAATVHALASRRVEIRDEDGEVKAAWDAPGRRFPISRRASVIIVERI